MNVYGMGLSGLSDGLVSKHPFFLVNTDFMTPPQSMRSPIVSQRKIRVKLVYLQFRSEEHTSELQSLMRISYAVFCLKKKKKHKHIKNIHTQQLCIKNQL